ncbi:MAG: single-stranded DNA-binding protein [Candidatus Anammoxibacter sp.]
MSNFNKVFLMGNITRDPELRYMPNGTAIVSFGMAINRTFKSQDGEQKKETCFVDINMFGRRAEVISEYFSKGSSIFIEGRLRFEQWEAQDGQKRSKLVVVADNFEFLGSAQKNREDSENSEPSRVKPKSEDTPGPELGDNDDDINNPPF